MIISSLNERYIQYDLQRIIAAFAVVILHISAQRFYDSFPSNEWEWLNVYDALSRWSVPVFVMISGALFLDENRAFSIKKLYKKNIVRIIIAFIFWSVIYELYKMNKDTSLWQFICGVIGGPVHLWFLKMLLGLYVAIPILRLVVADKKIEIYFLAVAILTAFFIPLLPRFLGWYDPILKGASEKMIDTIDLNIATGYTGYFVLGHFLHTMTIKQNVKRLIYASGILSAISVVVLTSIFSHIFASPFTTLYGNLMPFTLLEAIAVFVFVKDYFHCISHVTYRLILSMSKYSFGIYLIHLLVISIADDVFGINSSICNAALFVPCFSIIVFIISYCISWILGKVPLVNRCLL